MNKYHWDSTLPLDIVSIPYVDHADIPTLNLPLHFFADQEPTSALDPETALAVEEYTLSMLRKPENTVKAIIWITHSEEQGHRVGTRFITIAGGKAHEDLPVDLV